MIYNDFRGKRLSALGLGCMRLPVIDKDNARIDVAATEEMIAYAIKNGINYFDTAWGYHSGNSELVAGELLSKYPRESYYLASKFPGFDVDTFKRKEEVFERQLEKCRVDYFDFYLCHNVCERNIEEFLSEEYGLFDYLLRQKEAGRIKHIGFSTHGTLETMKRFLDAYAEHLEFCQIQINWLDWKFQNAKAKVELVQSYGLPVWVMEPVRGGGLCKLSEKNTKRLAALRPEWTLPEWAFRYLQSLDGVVMTLSGMSNMQQLRENVETYRESIRLSDVEMQALMEIADEITSGSAVPCTACSYCVEKCPKGLGIPRLMELYNEHTVTGGGFIAPMAVAALAEDKRPDACIGCRSCEKVCPQDIKISEVLALFAERLKK